MKTMAAKRKITSFFDKANAKKPKSRTERLQNASFQLNWKVDFPWVFLSEDGKMFCRFCIDTKKANVFTTGCGEFMKDYLKKHNTSVDHKQALQERVMRKTMQTSIVKAHSKDKATILSAMRTAYYLGKKNRPCSDFEELLTFQAIQVRTVC